MQISFGCSDFVSWIYFVTIPHNLCQHLIIYVYYFLASPFVSSRS
uniref:Uncharacterized protein n=1 Tax=Arundo donax TaxID=35708 RepID=A0A0A9A1P4_ARUDO